MIILISAVGSTGKTLLAQNLLAKYHIPYLSIDHLKMGLYRGDKDCGFTPFDNTEVIADKLWPIIKGIIKTNIENGQHLIIEGCYILPHYLAELESYYAQKVIPIFFGFSADYIKGNYGVKIIKYRNIIEDRKSPEERTVAELVEEHRDFKSQCLKSGVRYFEITQDYEKEIQSIYDYLPAKKLKIDRV